MSFLRMRRKFAATTAAPGRAQLQTTLRLPVVNNISPPTAPVITAGSATASSIQLALTTPSTAGSGIDRYEVERSLTGTGGWTVLTTDATFPYSATGLSAATEYFFRARAVDNNSNVGPYSANTSATTQSSVPSNDITHGQLFTFTGSGFGTRGNFGPAGRLNKWFLDFEEGLEDDGWNYNNGAAFDSEMWKWMSTGNRHARSTHWAKRHSLGDPSNTQYIRTSSSFSTGKFFFSYWAFNSPNSNGKTFRIWYRIGFGEDLWHNQTPGNVASDGPNQYTDFGAFSVPTNVWTRIDVYMRNGGNGALFDMWRLGANGNNPTYTKNYNCFGLGTFINPAIGAGEDGPGPTVFWGYDDFYADFTPARVEITNSTTWTGRTRAEIQTPVSWADGTITCRANCGAFNAGEVVNVWVINDSNVPIGSSPVKQLTVQ